MKKRGKGQKIASSFKKAEKIKKYTKQKRKVKKDVDIKSEENEQTKK